MEIEMNLNGNYKPVKKQNKKNNNHKNKNNS